MSQPTLPSPAKLVISLLTADKALYAVVGQRLIDQFGPLDLVSAWLPFQYTEYYTPEMGSPLWRRMLAFKKLIQQEELPSIKSIANQLEEQLSTHGKRTVNLDPGYLLLERFVLATGKNYTHRIYISQGIYADLTLLYQKKAFQKLPWTYPDYAAEDMLAFLTAVRKKYRFDLNQAAGREFTQKDPEQS